MIKVNPVTIKQFSYENCDMVSASYEDIMFFDECLVYRLKGVFKREDEKTALAKEYHYDMEQTVYRNQVSSISFGFNNEKNCWEVDVRCVNDTMDLLFENREECHKAYMKIKSWKNN